MNPNLNFSVTEPGCANPCSGYSDPVQCGWGGTVQFARIRYGLSAISLLEAGDPDGMVWTKADRLAMRMWIKEFLDWWLNTPLGRSARALQNNIGLCYTVCTISMALYSEQPELGASIVAVDARRHLAQQITPEGLLPHEDDPHDLFSFGYHVGDLIMLFEMGFVSNQTASQIDIYNYHTKSSGSLVTALEWLAPYCSIRAKWPIGPTSPDDVAYPECVILFRMAANALYSKDYEIVSRNATSGVEAEFCFGMDAREWMDLMWPSVFGETQLL